MPDEPSVAIPVRDGGALFERTLRALSTQTVTHELVVCDSGSRDGSAALARSFGARVIEIDPREFGHGRTRNLLMASSRGARVAFLTQDAEPAGERWLERLLEGFALAPDVAVVFGPYLPRSGASFPVALELERWFASLSPEGKPRVDRLEAGERGLPASALLGARGFLSDANACLARSAWERVPFRDVPYAEDRTLALDLLRAGYAKVYVPSAAVVHSHDYTSRQRLRRSFDEWRALLEVYGWREPATPAHIASQLRGALGQARGALTERRAGRAAKARAMLALLVHHASRTAGAILGSRADHLPPSARRFLSLERRGGYEPLVHGGTPRADPETKATR